jgi:2,4-diaminopentanoate dehydrogenase
MTRHDLMKEVHSMSQRTYRVIQWATGQVGKVALRHFVENPTFELVGVLVTSPAKVGKDAGEIAGLPPTGVIATDDVEKIIALDADCVHFTPLVPDLDLVCRLLRSGKNVVSPLGPFYPTERNRAQFDKIEAACRDGGTSFHGCGIHPGFSGDLLPLTLTRLMDKIDRIQIYEVIDKLRNPMVSIGLMGFGRDPDELLAKPSRSAEAPYAFAQSMTMVVEGLGKKIEKLTTKLEVATAKKDIAYPGGVIRAGTVAGQHYEWTAWADGAPFITYHFYWSMGDEIEPRWELGDSCYRVVIEGNPPLELTLASPVEADGRRPFLGLPWTALLGVTVIPQICDAAPGVITHLDLGVVRPRGLVRP